MEKESIKVQLFENGEWKVRAIKIDGEPWFVGADVADALGYKNTRDALNRHVDDDDKNTVAFHDGIQGNPNMVVINESGVYSLILRSNLPKAKEFKRWVTSVVLPSIRKHGAYITQPTIENILANPDYGIKLLQELKKERELKEKAQASLAIAAPKAEAFDGFMSTDTLRCFRDVCKDLGLALGANKFINLLIADKVLYRNNKGDIARPYQEYVTKGYFKMVERYSNRSGNSYQQTMATPKGMEWLRKRYKDYIVNPTHNAVELALA